MDPVLLGIAGLMLVSLIVYWLWDRRSGTDPGGLPDGPLGPGDLLAVRFERARGGYREVEVDEILHEVAARLAELENPPQEGLGAGGMQAGDLVALTLPTSVLGYRMDQVDEVLDRAQARLAELGADGQGRRRP